MKRLMLTALACLLFVSCACSAMANEWGLRGGIYDIVTKDDRYEGYTCPTADADDGNHLDGDTHVNHAIVQNRYHAQLIAAAREEGLWMPLEISTTAVYQPGDKRGEYPNSPRLEHIPCGFVLSYGNCERYTFTRETDEYVLTGVEYVTDPFYSNTLMPHEGGMLFWQSGPGDAFLPVGDALWLTDKTTLEEFNIAQSPRSMAEVRRLNQTSAALREAAPPLCTSAFWPGEEAGRMVPVYSAPDASSFRSGSGKAAVSLKGFADLLGTVDGWTLIQYEVSPRTSRFGYVEGELGEAVPLTLGSVPLAAAVDTFLTDDPFVSQFAQADIPAGAQMTGLAQCGEYYAYVEYSDGRQLCRGFVPMKDVHPLYDCALPGEHLTADVRWDVMDALCGKWYVPGNAMDRRILYSNGVYRNHMPGDATQSKLEANYRVYDRADGGYDLIIYTEDNQEYTWQLILNTDATITLTNEEGSTTWKRDEYSTYGNG